MRKSIFIIMFLTYVSLSGCLLKDSSLYRNKVEINSTIKDSVNNRMTTTRGLSMVVYHNGKMDSSTQHCLIPNANRISYKDTSESIFRKDKPYFAYAFIDKLNEELNINISNVFLGSLIDNLELKIKKNLIFSSYYSIKLDGKEQGKYVTQKYNLILDKPTYNIGDTIRGYTFYQGSETILNQRRWKYKFFFECVVGETVGLEKIITKSPFCNIDSLDTDSVR